MPVATRAMNVGTSAASVLKILLIFAIRLLLNKFLIIRQKREQTVLSADIVVMPIEYIMQDPLKNITLQKPENI